MAELRSTDFDNAGVTAKENFQFELVIKSLESWHTVKTSKAENLL